MKLNYFNIQKFCLHDGPGIRTTVFLKGCPLRCVWCHNPESHNSKPELLFSAAKCVSCGLCLGYCDARHIDPGTGRLIYERDKCTVCGKCEDVCPKRANGVRGKVDTVDFILAEVMKDKHYYDPSGGGMTVSGGEPSMQPDAVLELIAKAREQGVRSAVETCGAGERGFYMKAADLGCIFLYDIKGVDPEKHEKNTGVGVEWIQSNLDALIERGAEVVIRMPMIPGYNDADEDLALLRDFLRSKADGVEYAEIMPYHRLGVEKRRNLGLVDDDSIPDGKQFIPRWKAALDGCGTEIRVSGS